MNYQLLREEILDSPRAANYASNVITNDMPAQDAVQQDHAIADAINADNALFKTITSRAVKRGDFLRVLGPSAGASLFTKLKNAGGLYEPLKYLNEELEDDGLSISSESILDAMLEDIDANSVTLSMSDMVEVKKVFMEKQTVTAADVSIALRGSANFRV